MSSPGPEASDESGGADTEVSGVVAGTGSPDAPEEPAEMVEEVRESPVVAGAAPGPGSEVVVETSGEVSEGGAEIVDAPASMGSEASGVVTEGGSAAGSGGAASVTIGAGAEVLAIDERAARRVLAGTQEQDVRCEVAETGAATLLGAAWTETGPAVAAVAAATALATAAAAGSAGAGVVSAGVASVGVAPTPNPAGSTPTLLSTTGGAGPVAAVFAAGLGVAGWRSTWLVTIGTRWGREAVRCGACVAKGAFTVDGCAFRGVGMRREGNWRVGATTGLRV